MKTLAGNPAFRWSPIDSEDLRLVEFIAAHLALSREGARVAYKTQHHQMACFVIAARVCGKWLDIERTKCEPYLASGLMPRREPWWIHPLQFSSPGPVQI